jgi:CDGSH-type Zn-finger protein
MASETPAKKGSQKDARVQVSENGPYIVSGWTPLAKLIIGTDAKGYPISYVVGEEYPPKETYALCRCGQSESKPFCDGTHAKVHFDGTEIASRKREKRHLRLYRLKEGEAVLARDKPAKPLIWLEPIRRGAP